MKTSKQTLLRAGVPVLEIAAAFARHPVAAAAIAASRPYSPVHMRREIDCDPRPVWFAGQTYPDGSFSEIPATRCDSEPEARKWCKWANDRHQRVAIASLVQNDSPACVVVV